MNFSVTCNIDDLADIDRAIQLLEKLRSERAQFNQGPDDMLDLCTLLCEMKRNGATSKQLVAAWREHDPNAARYTDATLRWRLSFTLAYHGVVSTENWNQADLQRHLANHRQVWHRVEAVG